MIQLSKADRKHVLEIIKKGKSAREITRAHALNLSNKGYCVIEIADILEITPRTVINITNNYKEGGLLKALKDDPRPGQPPKFDDRIKTKIVATVCSNPPEGFDRWTLELLQEKIIAEEIVDGISRETIRIILHEHDLKPWQYKMWCVTELDDEFIKRMEDLLDVYEKPYDPARPVICLDEKPVPLTSDKRPVMMCCPGSPKRMDYEYGRHGSANVYCAVEPKAGVYFNYVTPTKTQDDFAKILACLYRRYDGVKKVILVLDNYGTHFQKSLIKRYGPIKAKEIWNKFDIHYTPIHGSWLNQAEIAIGMYNRQCMGSSRIATIDLLRKKTKAWNRIINRKGIKITWQFTKFDAREKFHYKVKKLIC